MRIFHWNCQGLRNPLTVRFLDGIRRQYRPDIMFLIETKNRDFLVYKIGRDMGYSNAYVQSPVGLSGGLAIFWDTHVNLTIKQPSSMYITTLRIEETAVHFSLLYIYGHPIRKERNLQWLKLIEQEDASNRRDSPMLFLGDFNDIKEEKEKKGGPRRTLGTFANFRAFINHFGLVDLRTIGGLYTWSGKRGNHHVKTRIDRAMGNSSWLDKFPNAFVSLLKWNSSDHRALLLDTSTQTSSYKKLFRYDGRWGSCDEVKSIIAHTWEESCKDFPPSDFFHALKICRHNLSKWKKGTTTNSAKMIQELEFKIHQAYGDNIVDYELIDHLKDQLSKAHTSEEEYWRTKSRVQWLQAGDRNTSFFHAKTKQRRNRNRITLLKDTRGIVRHSETDIKGIIIEYFNSLFTSQYRHEEVLFNRFGRISAKVSPAMNRYLTRPVTEDEIFRAISQMDSDKTPGPDGLTSAFFKHHWDTIKTGVINFVLQFFNHNILDPQINHTHICLIPKIENPLEVKDYRPISLCNIAYKIISKIMAERLKPWIHTIISENQTAFIPGRLITDNVLITHELLHSLTTRNRVNKYMALKLDIAKAFDKLEWKYIEFMLKALGFSDQWCTWVMTCITSVSYSVLINGSPVGNIQPQRGIRQGDPISPYIYLICSEGLSHMISAMVKKGDLHGFRPSKSGPSVSHIFFADDSLLFCKADERECSKLLQALQIYGEASGQYVNFSKSAIMFAKNTSPFLQQSLQSATSITRTGGFGRYLGLPETIGRSKSQAFAFIQQRVQERLDSWYSKLLSPAGKEVLIKAVVTALPTYAMQCFLLPSKTLKIMTQSIRNFWWSSSKDKYKVPWVAWEKITKPKNMGGLGFKDLKAFNIALLSKQVWRMLKEPSTLLTKIFKAKYFNKVSILEAVKGSNTSPAWKGIYQCLDFIKRGLRWNIGNGENTRAFLDNWLYTDPPRPPRGNSTSLNNTFHVSALIGRPGNGWDHHQLQRYIHPNDIPQVQLIRPSLVGAADNIEWIYSDTGEYTAKSGYKAMFSDSLDSNPHITTLCSKVWKLQVPPKIHHFWWKVLQHGISVNEECAKRGLKLNTLCQLCGEGKESINHMLFQCRVAKEIWELAPLRRSQCDLAFHNSLTDNVQAIVSYTDVEDGQEHHLPAFIGWRLWKSRNLLVFQNHRTPIPTVINQALSNMTEWLRASKNLKRTQTPHVQQPHALQHSLTGVSSSHEYVVSVDASWKSSTEKAGFAWVIHNSRLQPIVQGSSSIDPVITPLETEAIALKEALSQVIRLGNRNIAFCGDNQAIYANLSKVHETHCVHKNLRGLYHHLHDISIMVSNRHDITFHYIRRTHNCLADSLARLVREMSGTYVITWL